MRPELQQIGALCVALLLGGFVSLCLFLVMIFLIEPERTINSHLPRPYVVTFVATEPEMKKKKTRGTKIEIPKPPSSPELASIRVKALQKVTSRKISVHLPNFGQIDVSGGGRVHVFNSHMEAGGFYSSKDNHKVQFSGVERKYSTSSKEETQAPERFRIVGGGEIDRIGKYCYEVPSAGGSGSSDTGQSAVAEDEGYALRSLSARQVPCNKTNNSVAQDFLKQLEKRGLIMAPVSVTH